MDLHQLIAGFSGARLIGEGNITITGITYDSRRVEPGSCFVAIRGGHVDGHAYLHQAAARGAAALVVDERHWDGQRDGFDPTLAFVVVPDSRTALAPLAAAFFGHPGRQLGVIGITGTKGKSTTTDLTSRLLDSAGFTSGLISTVDFKVAGRRWPNDTRQSTPEALEVQALLREMVEAGCHYAVIEATSHALSPRWNRLGGCAFDVAVFLNLSHEHLDYHGTFEQYRDDKTQLFRLLGEDDGVLLSTAHRPPSTVHRPPSTVHRPPSTVQKWAIANADDPNSRFFLEAAPATAQRLTFAIQAEADVRAYDVVASPEGAHFRLETPWGSRQVNLRLPGLFNVSNALAALSVALCQGANLETACAALESMRSVRGRMERIEAGQPFGVIVDYAHNPDSFEQVMSMLRPVTQGRLIAVFGSAGERDREKRAVQGFIAARYCDLLVLTDEDPRGEDREAIIDAIAAGVGERAHLIIPDRATAIRAALAEARPGDLVLLLGKGHERSIIYADHSLPWDEAAEARKALEELGYRAGPETV